MCAARVVTTVVCVALGVAVTAATSYGRSLNRLPPARAPCSVLSGEPCHPSFCGVFEHGPCLPYDEPTLPETLRLTIISTDQDNPNNGRSGDAGKDGVEMLNNEDGNWSGDDADKPGQTAEAPANLDSIRDMFAALRGCWVPPPKDTARHGMQYTIRFAFKRDGEMIAPPRMTYASHDASPDVRDTYRDAIDAALKRCTPLHFTAAMGGAVAGRPIAIRFVDERTIDTHSNKGDAGSSP
jgi:hypothetical protein